MTGKQRIREILQQSVQFTLLGDFPTAVPKDHNNWVNVMGKVYAFDFDQALDSIEEVFKDCLGEREKTRPEIMSEQMGISVRGYDPEITPRNNLRVEVLGRWESK